MIKKEDIKKGKLNFHKEFLEGLKIVHIGTHSIVAYRHGAAEWLTICAVLDNWHTTAKAAGDEKIQELKRVIFTIETIILRRENK
jgi:hypothetical protein